MSSDDGIRRVAVFGGTGFLGRRITARLAEAWMVTRVAVRNLGVAGTAEGLTAVYADVRDETSVALALEGCDAAVNAVGLLVRREIGGMKKSVPRLVSFEDASKFVAASPRRIAASYRVDRVAERSLSPGVIKT
jgi:uncharacterized protein YbjT (DUF2867 family)